MLGVHIANGACLSYEVIPRRIDDRGGGLARVGGRVRLLEGLALPREEDEFRSDLLQLDDHLDRDRALAAGLHYRGPI